MFGAPFLYSPELRSKFDLVGFDPRGIGRSTALKCFGNLDQATSIFRAPVIAFPKDVAEAEAWFADDQRLADACDQRGSKVLDLMATANVASDLDLMRAAVGDDQLTYAGYSYGSYAGAQDTLEEFFRLRDAAGPPACAFAPDSEARYAAIAEYLLENEPVFITVPAGPGGELAEIPVFYGDLIGMSLGSLYDPFSWSQMAQELAFLEATIAGTATVAPAGFEIGQRFQPYTAKRGFPRYYNFVEGFPAVACADSDNPDQIADWVAAAGDISFDDYFRQIWTYASSPCLAFPTTGEDRYTGPFDAETADPVLVASTLYDTATPVHGAFEVDAILPNSGLLLVEGWGHTTLGLSGCASFFSEQYLITENLPPAGLVCPQDFDPFSGFTGPPADGMGTEFAQRRLEARERYLSGS